MRRRDDPRRGVRERQRPLVQPHDERDDVAHVKYEYRKRWDDGGSENQVAREDGREERLPDKERRGTHHGGHGQKMPPVRLHRTLRPKVT